MNLDITLQEYLGTAPEGPQGRLGEAPKGPEGGREGGCESEEEHVGDREHDGECEGEFPQNTKRWRREDAWKSMLLSVLEYLIK